MSIRRRNWTTPKGEAREGWIVDYFDSGGIRRQKGFDRKKDADAFDLTTGIEIREGTHVADSASATVKEAGEKWLITSEGVGLERTTIAQYQQHLKFHIVPMIGGILLSKLNAPTVRAFEDRLRIEGRSFAMVRKVMVSLSSILTDAQERGLVARNVVRDLRGRRKHGKERQAERRLKGKLKIGVDVPTREEIKVIVVCASGRWRPLIITAIFTGLRASELRGLRWCDVDFKASAIHVRQRADAFNMIGSPKSAAGERSVPMTPMVFNTLKEWKLACPKGALGLVFPNGKGRIENHGNIIRRGLIPLQIKAGVTDGEGETATAKYTGLHAFRHFFASWCINRKEDGGLGLPAKMVQERMGHATINVTMDTYGHLFPRGDDQAELAAAERALFS